jgi:DNA-directed RNA polymerase subunit RPC12/RpoP
MTTRTNCAHCGAPYMRDDLDDGPDRYLCPDCADAAVMAEPCPDCDRIPGRRPCRPVPRSDLADW